MAILGIDYGRRRIGLAIADSVESFPYPLGTFERASAGGDVRQIEARIQGRKISHIVVGLPLNMDGTEGGMARSVRRFAMQLSEHLHLPVDFMDERLTSFEARDRLVDSGARRRKGAIDTVAATIILEEWIAAHRNTS